MRPWASRRPAALLRRFVLRRALRHDAVRLDVEAVVVELALEHDLGFVLERVGHDAGVRRVDDVPRSTARAGLFCTLNRYSSVSGACENRSGHDVAVQLQLLALPRLRARHHFVDVLEVLGAVAQRRPQQAGKGEHEHARPSAPILIYRCVIRTSGKCEAQNSPTVLDARTMQAQPVASARSRAATGSPTTFEYDPSIRGMNRDARPWIA